MPTYPALWFTSRTPTDQGQRHCRFARFLGYHAGSHGTGYRRKALSVPLATGSAVHTGAELLADWILEYQQKHHGMPPAGQLPIEVIHWAASEAAAGYEQVARAKGFNEVGLEGVGEDADPNAPKTLPAALETLIMEQRTLIEAQVWIFALIVVPQMLSSHRILGYEVEETLVLDCTCGLGEGVSDWQVHAARDCAGIVQMGRADWLLEGHAPDVRGKIDYQEFKTKATPNAPWEKAWEHSGQLRVNMETAGRRLGKQVDSAHIVVLFKGWRGRDKGDPPEEPKYQHSPLVYGYFDPGSEGFRDPNWAAQYKWFDDFGKGHTLPKTYQKHEIWDVTKPMAGATVAPSRVGTWMLNYITPKQWPELVKVLGPFPYQKAAIPDTLRSVLAEERAWRADVEDIRAELHDHRGQPNARNEIDIAADVIPRSWQCTQFSGEPCPFKPVCDHNPGWEDPLKMGLYDIRTPHHATERAAYEACGVEFPPDDSEMEEIEV